MRNFLLGLAVGVAAAYVATKLVDDETRAELCKELDDATDKAKEKFRHGVSTGRGKALRMGVRARQEYRAGKKKLSQQAGDFAGKLSEELAELEEKAKAKAAEVKA
ncbi:hypothetical protein [Dysgonomonas macrotermitis]|uniref:YtxH-like protein n=1 Tax=Dysgonomonas macrotermitis TaxID=1346286 RepID=A0A1M5HG11_9BACT|nr:hypothetical protein [Dysgonomonas macrotermitis]SHG14880.1 hypothetical protein SAMN05444362_11654 [Dysgonomonas macrotermitis]